MNNPNMSSYVKMSSKTLRSSFLNYFSNEHNHTFVRSSPVVPFYDNSIAFVNSGMCQFKNIFLGKVKPAYPRVVNSQKCIRVGGKHNDLSVVGRDNYHHTFFEMLGNWSFNDYYKRKACKLAFDYLTQPPLSLPINQLYFTYFGGYEKYKLPCDEETLHTWLELGVPKSQIVKEGMDSNFWEMGNLGPCGCSSEIHFDLKNDPHTALSRINKDSNDLFEIWNIVFMSHNRTDPDTIVPLSKKFIDTGLGFERLVTITQNKYSTYDTDLFVPLLETITRVSKAKPYCKSFSGDTMELDTQYRILSDYSRMITVALSDNMFPDATPKLRNIIRDALIISEDTFHIKNGQLLSELSHRVAESLGESYPEIRQNIVKVQKIISEESRIFDNLRNNADKEWKLLLKSHPELVHLSVFEEPGLVNGIKYLNKELNEDDAHVTGQIAFTLYDTYGLSESTIQNIATSKQLKLDQIGFEQLLKKLKLKSKNKTNEKMAIIDPKDVEQTRVTDDHFKYNYTFDENKMLYTFPELRSKILAIVIGETVFNVNTNYAITHSRNLSRVDSVLLEKNSNVGLIFDKTNFYAEAGGQVNDIGTVHLHDPISNEQGIVEIFNITSIEGKLIHYGKLKTDFRITPSVACTLVIQDTHRSGCMRAHTASHLINEALKSNLTCTYQKSCRVSNDIFAFDFSVFGENLNINNIENIEHYLKNIIDKECRVERRHITSNEMLSLDNVTTIPGEVYPDDIILIEITEPNTKENSAKIISREPCCGTHVHNTKHIHSICIVNYKSYNHGVRSIKCLTGEFAERAQRNGERLRKEFNKIENCVNKESNELNENELKNQKQNLKLLKQTFQTQKYEIPFLIQKQYDQLIQDLNKTIKLKQRKITKIKLINELKDLFKNRLNDFYIVHYTNDEDVEVQTLPSLDIIEKPFILVFYSKSELRCRSYVPNNHIIGNFNAETWLSDVIKHIKAKGVSTQEFDTRNIYNIKSTIVKSKDINKTIEDIKEIAGTTFNKLNSL